MFNVPSTPDSRRGDDIDNPSTTPAGPPPTGFTSQSFTPAGRPPPSSVLGSSFGQGNGLATKSPFSLSDFMHSTAPSSRVPSKGFAVPSSSPPQREKINPLDDTAFALNGLGKSATFGHLRSVVRANNHAGDVLDIDNEPRGSKRSRSGDAMAQSTRSSRMLGREIGRDSIMPSIVDGLVAGMATHTALEEHEATISYTVSVLEEVDDTARSAPLEEVDQAILRAVKDLHQEWSKQIDAESAPASIGPVDRSGFARAFYIATLLLQLYHPTRINSSVSPKSTSFTALARQPSLTASPPKALLDWLNNNHNPFPEDLPEVQSARPSSTAHERFWDTIFQTLLRGQFSTVIKLLGTANWSHADCSQEDGYQSAGYTDAQVSAIDHVVGQCVDLLRACPAITDDDWDMTNADWSLFRSRTRRVLDDLEQYAGSQRADREYGEVNVFTASGPSFAAGSRRAQSKVPYHIFEQLKAVYGQLLGSKEEILLSAQDWLEASIYLTVWWDGEEEASLSTSRRGFHARQRERSVDYDPIRAYQKRLLSSFASVTDDPQDGVLSVNTVDAVQVALGAVFEGEVESVLRLLQKWSPLVSAAVVEIARAGGWMPSSQHRSGDIMDGFDQEDLMVLSHGQINQKKGLERDDVLVCFAELLAKEGPITSSDRNTVQQGWELAVRVLSRLDSNSTAQKKIGEVFDNLSFSNAKQVDKALSVCNNLTLTDQVRRISERYADSLASTSHSYGEALLYYARAHSESQLRSTLDLLLSTSLVRSAAYPASSDIDPQLADLLTNQTGVLSQLSRIDVEAAKLLADKSSGYATLRRFYELRDEDDEAEEDDETTFRSGLRPAARKKEMVKGLVALVDSAGESIRGGLYDSGSVGVVQVDTLLSLLGEALPLLNDPTSLFSKAQLIALLRATEDLETVSSRIYELAETVFQASMSDYHSERTLEPQELAKSLRMGRSTANLSGSAYGMVDSKGSIESERSGNNAAAEDAEGDRAWDWRRGLALAAGKNSKGSDVLRILRIAIAREIGRGWAAGQ